MLSVKMAVTFLPVGRLSEGQRLPIRRERWCPRSGSELASIVVRAQEGDQAAFDMIYEQFADALFRYLYARCGSAALAEELTGDVWVRVVERLPTFRFAGDNSEAVFAAWLYTIARNLLIDYYRRKRILHIAAGRDAFLARYAARRADDRQRRPAGAAPGDRAAHLRPARGGAAALHR